MVTTQKANTDTPRSGDWVEVHEAHGQGVRRGQILEVLGHGKHARYRVRWNESHESILYPSDGVRVIPGARHAKRRAGEIARPRP